MEILQPSAMNAEIIPFVPKPMGILGRFAGNRFARDEKKITEGNDAGNS